MIDFLKPSFSSDPIKTVKQLIQKWSPRKCETEKDFENHLYKYLHEQLPEVQVAKQPALAGVKADILVGEEILIELKLNLKKREQFTRLKGQLDDYKKWKGALFLVLIGNTDPHYRKQLEKMAEPQNASTFFDEANFHLLVK